MGQAEYNAGQIVIEAGAESVPEGGAGGPIVGQMGAERGFADASLPADGSRMVVQEICRTLLNKTVASN